MSGTKRFGGLKRTRGKKKSECGGSPAKSTNKYGAVQKGRFGSKVEYERFLFLESLEKKEKITELSHHPRFRLTPPDYLAISYEPDAIYIDTSGEITGVPGAKVVEDTKGALTDVFKIKAKLFLGKYPEYFFLVVKGQFKTKNKVRRVVAWKAYRLDGKSWKFRSALSVSVLE